MEMTPELTRITEILEGLNEIKRSVNSNGYNKYTSRVLKTVNVAILDAEREKNRLLVEEV